MRTASLIALCASIVVARSASAYWVQDGAALCTATGQQYSPTIVSDGIGGAIVTWQDYRNGNYDIYAQRMNGAGAVQWTANGVPLCTATGDQSVPKIISDGAGGAVVTWYDTRNGMLSPDIYAQRVNGSGIVQWTANGAALCTATGSQAYPTIASDGVGGAIVTWQDKRGANADIYVQRVNASGIVQWAANGVALCAATGDQSYPTVTDDGSGGAIVTWQDYRTGLWDLYIQRVNASGVVQWTANGVALCTAAGEQLYPVIASDGAGGAIVSWFDYRSGTGYDVYAQRVNAAGAVQWMTDGVVLCAAAGSQSAVVIVSDGAGGAFVAWQDYRTGSNADIYAQRVAAGGAAQWTANGVALCAAAGDQQYPAITPDGAGGAIVAWQDARGGAHDVYAQLLSADGVAQWAANGVVLCAAAGNQWYPTIASDGARGAIVTWQDYRSGGSYDIYAQSIDARGRAGSLAPGIFAVVDVPGDEGGWVRISFDKSKLDDAEELALPISTYGVWLRIDNPGAIAQSGEIVETGELPPGAWELLGTFAACQVDQYTFRGRTRGDSTGDGTPYSVYFVSASTTTPSVWYTSEPDSGFSVDNLAPGAPGNLAGEPSSSRRGIVLTWDRNMEEDLGCYRVYRGVSEGFIPDPSNRIASTVEATFIDGDLQERTDYYYKVSAVDVHGNESAFALLAPGDVTGAETPMAPDASYLAQNCPNPFNPMTSIAFGLPAPARVSLKVYDASGRLVRVLAEDERREGRYEETWDGTDSSGRMVASGIYFYRLVAGRFEETKKMILLR